MGPDPVSGGFGRGALGLSALSGYRVGGFMAFKGLQGFKGFRIFGF